MIKGKNKFTFNLNGFIARGSGLKDGKYPIVDKMQSNDSIQYYSNGVDNNCASINIKKVSFKTYYDQM